MSTNRRIEIEIQARGVDDAAAKLQDIADATAHINQIRLTVDLKSGMLMGAAGGVGVVVAILLVELFLSLVS